MVTKEQLLSMHWSEELHYDGPSGKHPNGITCTVTTGPRGGVTTNIVRVRKSGRVQTWKRNPERFRMPVKYGMYESAEITERNADYYHLASECPTNK